jgi:hypothetical protein
MNIKSINFLVIFFFARYKWWENDRDSKREPKVLLRILIISSTINIIYFHYAPLSQLPSRLSSSQSFCWFRFWCCHLQSLGFCDVIPFFFLCRSIVWWKAFNTQCNRKHSYFCHVVVRHGRMVFTGYNLREDDFNIHTQFTTLAAMNQSLDFSLFYAA